jgi:hypothetical protein
MQEQLPETPSCWWMISCLMRQWVLSSPFQLRFLFASRPEIMGQVLGIVYQAIANHQVRKAAYTGTAPPASAR